MPSPTLPPLPELVDDLLGEISLRLPPDDPACFLRASLTCKRWRRILADPAFRRRHREVHLMPLVLGFLHIVSRDVSYSSRFVSIDPASRRPASWNLLDWLVLNYRHGRALFITPRSGRNGARLCVWDPLTNEQRHLPRPSPPPMHPINNLNAAVLCAAAVEGCDHRGCHRGAFRVVFAFTIWDATTHRYVASACTYSSEMGDWSELTRVHHLDAYLIRPPCPSALVGNSVYFHGRRNNVFEYQLGLQRLSVIHPPLESMSLYPHIVRKQWAQFCLFGGGTMPLPMLVVKRDHSQWSCTMGAGQSHRARDNIPQWHPVAFTSAILLFFL